MTLEEFLKKFEETPVPDRFKMIPGSRENLVTIHNAIERIRSGSVTKDPYRIERLLVTAERFWRKPESHQLKEYVW